MSVEQERPRNDEIKSFHQHSDEWRAGYRAALSDVSSFMSDMTTLTAEPKRCV